jgi:hypothetical protein
LIQSAQNMVKSEWQPFTKQALSAPDRPTVVIAYRTSTARPFKMVATGMGIELQVATFSEWEDEDLAIDIRCVLIPFFEVGNAAVQMLRRKMLDPTLPQAPQAIPYSIVQSPIAIQTASTS